MSNRDQQSFYRDQIARYGFGVEGVGWRSATTQRRRFAILTRAVGSLAGRTLVDAGCGLGDLCLFLGERNNVPAEYLGLELLPEMAEEARRRTGCTVRQCDILRERLPAGDWYVASGSMNRLSPLEVRLFIRRCWEASRLGFAFNLLEGKGSTEGFCYHRPREILDYCRSLGARVELIEGYLEGDFTVRMG